MATKSELDQLEDRDLAHRIYGIWLGAFMHDDQTGAYDELQLTDDQARELVRALPDDLREQLRFGPMPEPRCGVCHALNHSEHLENSIVCALLDYHDKTMRAAHPQRWKGGAEAYRRCLVIYAAAHYEERANATSC